jgi:hypothetical protein
MIGVLVSVRLCSAWAKRLDFSVVRGFFDHAAVLPFLAASFGVPGDWSDARNKPPL